MTNDIRAFFRYVDKGDCWEWTGYCTPDGYARFRSFDAHRWAYQQFVGDIPEGRELDHLCRNRRCVKPDHLEAVTRRVNVLRGRSFAAVNAAKQACSKGHPFDSDNTYIRPNGNRDCRACGTERQRAYQRRKASA